MRLSLDNGITFFQPKYDKMGLEFTDAPVKKGDVIKLKGFGKNVDAEVLNVTEVKSLTNGGGWNISLITPDDTRTS